MSAPPPPATAALVLASPRAHRRRLVDLQQKPAALAGLFGPGAEIVGEPTEPDLDPDLAVPLRAAQRLAALPTPLVAIVSSHAPARPIDWQRPTRYTVVPAGYAELLDTVCADGAAAPGWLQNLILEQLFGYLRADSGLYTSTGALDGEVTSAFHQAVTAVVAHLDDDRLLGYPAPAEQRLALLLGAAGRTGHAAPQVRRDAGRGLVRVSYLFAGTRPDERFSVDGVSVQPLHEKVRSICFFERPLLHERIVWLPDRAQAEIDAGARLALPSVPEPGQLARYRRIARENSGIAGRVGRDLGIRARARSAAAARRYRDAWLLMDRDTAAQDNAEHLYRHLRAHEPDVNAWFVLARDSADWARLEAEGFRLLEHGSAEHFVALLNCVHLISSQVDSYVVNPLYRHALGRPTWRFTFLQHGIIKDDLSRWLNGKAIDLFATSTPDEHESIAGDHSPYVFTGLETKLIGLARHDRLLELAQARPGGGDQLVLMPTWRRELLGAQQAGNRRELLDSFWTSEFALGWLELLNSDRLHALCEEQGWQLAFVPHPNLADYLDGAPIPAHVRAHRFHDVDVQQMLAGAAAVVTDYSSLATEAAYIGRPVVYYQFDRATFFAGGHVYRQGAWSYEHQGFGPVTETVDRVVDAVADIIRCGGVPVPYAERAHRTFPLRDGRNCERTVAAIRNIVG